MPARAFIDLDQGAQVVVDDLGQRLLYAGAGHVHQHVNAGQQLVDHRRIAQIAMHQVFALVLGRQRPRAAGRAQVEATLTQATAQHLAHMATRPTQCHLGHRDSLLYL